MTYNDTFALGGDLTVRRLGFGAMRLTGKGIWGQPSDVAGCKAVLRRAVALGVNFIDTADSYGPAVSETLIGDTLYPYAHGLVIATKGGFMRSGPNQWEPNGRPAHLREALEGSLRRLKLERIDLYQMHRPDPKVPYAESLGALADLQKQGKIRHLGISNVSTEQLAEARKHIRVVSVQNSYSVVNRQGEDVLEACLAQNIAFIPYFPLGAGDLGAPRVLEEVAGGHKATSHQVALAWLLQHAPNLLPIPGTASVAHLEENVAAEKLKLTEADMKQLDTASEPGPRAGT